MDMERIVNKSGSFAEADAWTIKQCRSMTGPERMRAARELKRRVFPGKQPDVRECHHRQKTG
jgi:hypothetical protein